MINVPAADWQTGRKCGDATIAEESFVNRALGVAAQVIGIVLPAMTGPVLPVSTFSDPLVIKPRQRRSSRDRLFAWRFPCCSPRRICPTIKGICNRQRVYEERIAAWALPS